MSTATGGIYIVQSVDTDSVFEVEDNTIVCDTSTNASYLICFGGESSKLEVIKNVTIKMLFFILSRR